MSEPGPVDAEVARIRQRIRRWREEEKLTLQELAQRSGLATSTVQKVETGQMIPSVAVLLKMARGLGRRATELVHDGEPNRDVAHVRASERRPIGVPERLLVERLSSDLRDPALEMWRITLRPGASSGSGAIQYEGEEIVLCEAGVVTIRIGDDEYRLEAGDSLHFKAEAPHAWRNDGHETTRFTVTGTLPTRLRSLMHERLADVSAGRG